VSGRDHQDDLASPARRTDRRQLWLLYSLEFIVAIGFGVIYPYLPVFLHDVGHAEPWLIGVVAAVVFVGTFVFSGPFGRLCDRLGRKPVLLFGCVLFTATMFLFLTTTDPWWFVAFRFLEGVATAAVIPAVNALIADLTTDEDRSQAFGWITSAQFGGLILGPAIAVPIYNLGGGGTRGFHAIFLVGGVVTLGVSVALALMLREPARSRERLRAGSPERAPRWRVLATRPVVALIVLAATANFSTGGFEVLWSLWLKRLGASMTFISLTWIVFSVPMLFSFLGGRLADRTNRLALVALGYTAGGVCFMVYGLTHNLGVFLAVNLIEGVAWALSYPAKEAMLIKASPAKWLGAVQGMQTAAVQAAAFVGTLLGPLLYQVIGGYALSVDGLLALAGVAWAVPVLWRTRRRAPVPVGATGAGAGRTRSADDADEPEHRRTGRERAPAE